MVPVILILFIAVPIAEIAVAVKVADAIGGWNTIGLLIATSIVGAILVRHEGFLVLQKVRRQLDAGHMPGRELVDGALVLVGGVMMVVPGFITDAFGLFLLFPPTRAVARSVLIRRFRNRVDVYVPRPGRPGPRNGGGGGGRNGGGGPDDVIDV